MKSTRQIDIYLTKKSNVRLIDVVQYDTGIHLVFTVKDFDIPSGATAKLYVQKPSGKFVFQEDGITIVDNTILINLENQAITEHGKVPYQVSITNGSDMITTFTGLMMVEKSLKDSNATESKTVIRAFDEVVSDHVAEFQAKAEQIVRACIATIPEDYTVMEAKVNETANAIKGSATGAVVAVGDVSPVVHSPVVKVHGKNLIPYPYDIKTNTVNGITYTDNGDGSFTLNGTSTSNFAIVFLTNMKLVLNGTYSFSMGNKAFEGSGGLYLKNRSGTTVMFLATNKTSKTEKVNDEIDRFDMWINAGHTFNNFTICPQLEKGGIVTEYTPYLDPSTVTVRRCGKNLFPKSEPMTVHGMTMTVNEDGTLVFNGTATADAPFTYNLPLPTGKYTFALNNNNIFGETTSDSPYFAFRSASSVWLMSKVCSELALTRSFTLSERIASFLFAIPKGLVVSNYRIKPQLEFGELATEYEVPKGTTVHTPAADGTVSGMTSLSPNMTILTDTAGAIVECEYNIDTKTYIDRKIFEMMKGSN